MAILWDIWKLAGGFQSPNPSVFSGLVWYSASLCIFSLYGSRGNTCFTLKYLNVELTVFNVSESVVFSTCSSSLSPCAILAVDAIMSIQDTLSVFSSSPRSNTDALAAPLVLAGMILKAPLEDVTCLPEEFILGRGHFPGTSIIFSIGNARCFLPDWQAHPVTVLSVVSDSS